MISPVIKDRLKNKLHKIRAGQYKPADFILADAKDGDMAFGVAAPGPVNSGPVSAVPTDTPSAREFLSRKQYLANMSEMASSGLIDILLVSASTAEVLQEQSLFDTTDVTAAIRFNDTTDIWSARGSGYRATPSQPFATVDPAAAAGLCRFGLYSITFHNDVQVDLESLNQYKQFRVAAREYGLQHILEVFNPAFDIGLDGADLGDYINDMILKTLAGVTRQDAPLFLKMQFNGQRVMADLAGYDPENLVVGILGGSAGTTRDTFELALQAEEAGARVALFGRKINLSESPVELVTLLRRVIERQLTPEEAVMAFHAHLESAGIPAKRGLKDDLLITEAALKS